MSDQPMEIPDNLRHPFKRMIELLPNKALRNDDFQCKATLAFLKVGGERLARHHIKITTLLHKDNISAQKGLFRSRAVTPPVESDDKVAEAKPEAATENDTKINGAQTAKEAAPKSEPVDDFYM